MIKTKWIDFFFWKETRTRLQSQLSLHDENRFHYKSTRSPDENKAKYYYVFATKSNITNFQNKDFPLLLKSCLQHGNKYL
jgi:hypothetical protein